MVAAGFLSHYLTGPLPYVRRHITVNYNVLSASLNKTFPSFIHSKNNLITAMHSRCTMFEMTKRLNTGFH